MQKVPYMLIVGDREAEQNEVSVRTREGQDLKGQSTEAFMDLARKAIESKT
jgi:threonyl-tRNA synthetase